jgi:antitoxin MazE
MQVSKWGNSLAVRLPAKLVEQLGLKEGDEIELRPTPSGALQVERKPMPDELFDRVRQTRRALPADYRFDRDKANSRGRDDAE